MEMEVIQLGLGWACFFWPQAKQSKPWAIRLLLWAPLDQKISQSSLFKPVKYTYVLGHYMQKFEKKLPQELHGMNFMLTYL